MKNPPKPKGKPRPSAESVEIGQRLRQMRDDLGLSQSVAASELRVSRAQLANYEEARTPLRVEVGLDACSKFIYSEKWLAAGGGDARQLMNLRDDPIVHKLKRGTAFGAAYREILAPRYEQLLSTDPDAIRFAAFGQASLHDDNLLSMFRLGWTLLLDEEHSAELTRRLLELGNKFCAQHAAESSFDFSPGSSLDECGSILVGKQILRIKRGLKRGK